MGTPQSSPSSPVTCSRNRSDRLLFNPARAISRGVEAAELHFMEREDVELSVCRNSLSHAPENVN